MKLAVGQVWINDSGQEVLVLEVRDEQHPRGHGKGYGDTGIAVPIEGAAAAGLDPGSVHPFDIVILCGALPSHGLKKWKLSDSLHYDICPDGRFYPWPGPHPVRGDG